MFNTFVILLLVALPAICALMVSLLPDKAAKVGRGLTLAVMLELAALSVALFLGFDGTAAASFYDLDLAWIPSLGVNFHLGLDGLNLYLVLLTGLLFPVVLLCAWRTEAAGKKLYLCLLLFLQASLFGTFLSQNLMLFFGFWEAVLIPMFVLILVFGGEKRRQAAMTFFLYTLAGSVLLLAAVILLGVESAHQTGSWSFEFSTLYRLHLDSGTQLFVFVAVLLACLIKCPLFPFHSWLPLTYCEAPASGTAIMAGALSKMGAFGLLKLAIPLCPDVSAKAAPYLILLAVASILYGAVLALLQENFKKLIAYSSLSHMGYIVLGIFSFQQASVHGALFQMLSHGAAVAGLFLMLSLLEQRLGDSYLKLTALSTLAPRLAVTLMLFILASLALPLTSGFTSEFLILFGSFQQGLAAWQAGLSPVILFSVVLACSGMVLGAGYMLRFAKVILYGKSRLEKLADLTPREALAFLPLLALIFWIGVYPAPIMEKAQGAVGRMQAQMSARQTYAQLKGSRGHAPLACRATHAPGPLTPTHEPVARRAALPLAALNLIQVNGSAHDH
jgi:NADH-quinone oxidoreductase subunit M